MRKRQTFLLTILTPENGAASFCGQIKVISTGKVASFTNTDELYRLIASEMGEEGIHHPSHHDFPPTLSENKS